MCGRNHGTFWRGSFVSFIDCGLGEAGHLFNEEWSQPLLGVVSVMLE